MKTIYQVVTKTHIAFESRSAECAMKEYCKLKDKHPNYHFSLIKKTEEVIIK